MWTRVGLALLFGLAVVARGDEALRQDGTRVDGSLALTAAGRFTFGSEDVSRLERVRFANKPLAQPQGVLWQQARFGLGELILGELRKVDDKQLYVRTAWADSLAIPRTAIERVAHRPGWRTVFFDSFDGDLAIWKSVGEPRVVGGRLTFDQPGQSVEANWKSALPGARIDVGFNSTRTKERRLTLTLGFVRAGKPAEVTVELVGPGELISATSPDRPTFSGRVPRDDQPHRLTAEFDNDRLELFVDSAVVWASERGPGELRSLKIHSAGEGAESVSLDDVLVERPVRPTEPIPWADLTADAIRGPGGEETFGTLRTVGPTGVSFEVRGKPTVLRWADVTEFAFRRGPIVERSTAGEQVSIHVRSIEGVRDVLTGAVRAFDDKAIVLEHPVLGEITIPRARLEEIRFHFPGRRVPVDATPRHLGVRPAFGFAVPKPTGTRFVQSATIDRLPRSGEVVIAAARVNGSGTPVEVFLNNERLGELNRQAGRPTAEVRAYRLAVPATAWKRGANEVEVRLREPDAKATGVDLRGLWLELTDGR